MSLRAAAEPGRYPPRVAVGPLALDPVTATEAAIRLRQALARGEGGRIILLDATHHRDLVRDPALRSQMSDAAVVLTTSTAAVLASRLGIRSAHRLPGRVTPLGLTDAVCAVSNADARRVAIIGGEPGHPGSPNGARRAAAIISLRHRGLRMAGGASPAAGFDTRPEELAALVDDVRQAKPDVVLVGLDLAAAAHLVSRLRGELPGAWFVESARLVASVVGEADPAVRRSVVPAAGLIVGAVSARLAHRSHPRAA